MATVGYAVGITSVLQRELCELLQDNQVQVMVAQWLADKNILTVAAFADMAESKHEIIAHVGRPAGIDHDDPVACQPLKTAWRQAEAQTKADIEAKAKGDDTEADTKLGPTQRKRLDDEVKAQFNFTWPASMLPDDLLLGRLVRFYRKKTRYCPRLQEVRSLLEKGTTGRILLSFEQHKGMVGQAQEESDVSVGGAYNFVKRHQMAMIAYSQAAAPDFDMADLTVLLEYHAWVQEKAFDNSGQERPQLTSIVEADFAMRTKWMLSYCNGEFTNLTKAIQHHRGHSAYLFTGLRTGKGGGKGDPKPPNTPRNDRRPPPVPHTPPPLKRPRGNHNQPPPAGPGRQNGSDKSTFALEKVDPSTKKPLCAFYNKGSCAKGDKCGYIHKCNYPGCFKKHARCEEHPTKPS